MLWISCLVSISVHVLMVKFLWGRAFASVCPGGAFPGVGARLMDSKTRDYFVEEKL